MVELKLIISGCLELVKLRRWYLVLLIVFFWVLFFLLLFLFGLEICIILELGVFLFNFI